MQVAMDNIAVDCKHSIQGAAWDVTAAVKQNTVTLLRYMHTYTQNLNDNEPNSSTLKS